MSDSIEKKVFRQVKKTLQKITFSASAQEGKEKDPLITMNFPAYLAKRNAAYDRVIHLLRGQIFSLTEEKRNDLYYEVIKLVAITIDCTHYIASVLGPQNKFGKNEMGPIQEFLLLLHETVSAAHGLVKHELLLFKDEKMLSDFIGYDISQQFQSIDEIFSSSEMNVYQSIQELIDLAEPSIRRHRDNQKKTLSKNDLNRYNKSLAEFTTLYAKSGKLDT